MNKKFLDTIFSDMCCSDCRADFTAESVKVIRQEKDLYVVRLSAKSVEKRSGLHFLAIARRRAGATVRMNLLWK